MSQLNHFRVPMMLAVAVAIPLFANGCSSSSNPLCCTEFAVGAQIDASGLGGSAQSQVAVQAIADIGGITAGAVADVTASCRGIATDLGAAPTGAANPDNDADPNQSMTDWCNLAVSQIKSLNAQITLNITPAQCSASLSASADCQAKCDVSGQCDIKANPPTCTGGTLDVSCQGSCTGSASAPSIDCTGSCSGQCSGSCTGSATAAADCTGKCDGTCTAGGASGGTGIQADGSCNGQCSGQCTLKAGVKVSCKGSCSGTCDASCTATPGSASVSCSGTCSGSYTPLSCKGGTLSGGCNVDAKCQGNCNASVQATATCTPPAVSVTTNIPNLQATLEANLPKIFEVTTKFKLLGTDVQSVAGNFGAVTDIKPACIPVVLSAIGDSATQFTATVSATASVTTAVGGS